jgi:transposase InsO family protein
MARPNELWISDLFEFRIHKEKGYLVSFMDDFSRMIVGHRVGESCPAEEVVGLLDEAIARHGKPERVLTDRGGQYASFKGMSAFQKRLEDLDIDHSMARSYHPQTCGKIEAFHRSLTRELMEMRQFGSLGEAAEAIAEYIRHFNTTRTHMGIGGLTPADRYFGRQEEVLEEIGRRCAERKLISGEEAGELPGGNGAVEVLQMVLRGKALVVSFCGKEFQIG